ncbi:MAG: hypothetical protein U1E62_03420 [Alsobacter sp.]
MLHQPSTLFAATEPATAEGVSLASQDGAAAMPHDPRAPASADEPGVDQPWCHPARLAAPRAAAGRLFIDCASL